MAAHVGGGRPVRGRPGSEPPELRDRAPAAERDRRPAPRPRPPALTRRHDRPDTQDAGVQRPVPARVRPRRHLHAERRREAPRGGREVAPGSGPRGIRRTRLGLAPRVRRQDHVPVPADRRLAGLPPRAVHDGRGVRPGGDALLRPPVGEGVDLPRQPDRQLVPVSPDLAFRPRARARGRRRRAHLRSLSAGRGRRAHHDRHREGGDDSRRRRGRRPSRRRALPRAGRARGGRALGRAARAGGRRRTRRARLRHRRLEGDARPRRQGLRDRPRPRPAGAGRDRTGRPDERRGRAGSTA